MGDIKEAGRNTGMETETEDRMRNTDLEESR